jgi:hypothetical protein
MAGEADPIAPRTWVAIDVAKGVNVAVSSMPMADSSGFALCISEMTMIGSSHC